MSRPIAGRDSVVVCLLAALGLLWSAAAGAGESGAEAPSPVHPILEAVYADAAPAIDGRLDDECWSRAARLEGWCCLDVDQPVPEETEALVCVDDEAIYLAVICHDRSPDDIVANETRRNGDIWNDDFVWLCLDPWHQHKEGYFFDVTANGVQCEQIPGGSAAKVEWRGDWRAAAARTATGWQAEMAIPFAILRYPPGQGTFGLNVGRHFAREGISARYPAEMGIAADPSRAADLVGLQPPAISGRPVVMPYLSLNLGESAGGGFDAGLDLQHSLPNGLTALAVLNPDFKQIEDVVEPISFSYTERFLPDPRPFFVTGQEGYLPPAELLYTRRIEDFDAGMKLFGTIGDDTIGLLDAITLGRENALAGAWRHRFSDQMTTSLLVVSDRRQGAADSACYGLQADYSRRGPDGFDGLWLRLYQSQADAADPGGSYTIGGGHYRGVGHLRYNWQLQAVTEDFDPTLGYFPDTNYMGGEFSFGQWDHFESGALEGRGWFVNTYHYPYRRGDGMFRSGLAPSYSWSWRGGRSLDLGLSRARREGWDSSDRYASYDWNTRDMFRHGGIFVLKGSRLDGDYTYTSLDQGFRPSDRLAVHAATSYSHLTESPIWSFHGCQTVLTGSYDITPEKCVAARGIWRDAGFSAYASYRQVVRKGMDAYVIVGDPDPTLTGVASRVAVKLIWAL